MKKIIQLLSVGLALCLLASYVAYSQQKSARPVERPVASFESNASAAIAPAKPSAAVSPGSKSLVPLMRPSIDGADVSRPVTTSAPPAGAGRVTARGSKSSQIFTPREIGPGALRDLPAQPSNAPAGQTVLPDTGAVIYSSKSAPVFPLAPVPGPIAPAPTNISPLLPKSAP